MPGLEITSTAKTNLHWQFSQPHGDGETQQTLAALQFSATLLQQEFAQQHFVAPQEFVGLHSHLPWRSHENPMEVKAIATIIKATRACAANDRAIAIKFRIFMFGITDRILALKVQRVKFDAERSGFL